MTPSKPRKGLVLEVSHRNTLQVISDTGEVLEIELVIRPGRALRAKLNFRGDREKFTIRNTPRQLSESQKAAVEKRTKKRKDDHNR